MVLQFTGRGPCLSADCDACPFSDHVLEGRALGAFRCRRCGSCRSYVGQLVAPADPRALAIAAPLVELAIAWDRYETARAAVDPLYRQAAAAQRELAPGRCRKAGCQGVHNGRGLSESCVQLIPRACPSCGGPDDHAEECAAIYPEIYGRRDGVMDPRD